MVAVVSVELVPKRLATVKLNDWGVFSHASVHNGRKGETTRTNVSMVEMTRGIEYGTMRDNRPLLSRRFEKVCAVALLR